MSFLSTNHKVPIPRELLSSVNTYTGTTTNEVMIINLIPLPGTKAEDVTISEYHHHAKINKEVFILNMYLKYQVRRPANTNTGTKTKEKSRKVIIIS